MLDHVTPGAARHGIGRETAEQVGNRLRVADRPEETLHPGSGEAGKEVFQVHAQNDAPAYVRSGKGLDGASLHKAMRRGVRRNAVKDGKQNAPLHLFEARLGSLDRRMLPLAFANTR